MCGVFVAVSMACLLQEGMDVNVEPGTAAHSSVLITMERSGEGVRATLLHSCLCGKDGRVVGTMR